MRQIRTKMCLKLLLLSVFGCTCSLALSIDIGGMISGNRLAGVPLGMSLGDGELDVEGVCTEAGMACQNCSHAVTCVSLPVGWLKVPLEICPDGHTCNAHEGKCSHKSVPECDIKNQEFQHTCEQVGIFPDAYDCRKFHLCSPPEDLPDGRPADHRAALCPRQFGYNPHTAQCSIRLVNGQCNQKPVPNCKKVGQSGVLARSPNYYYVCLSKNGEYYPQVFICPNGWYFYDNFCQPTPQTVPTEGSNTSKSEEPKETLAPTVSTALTTTEKAVTTKIEAFFSTEKSTTYAVDTFLADKFPNINFTNYEATDYETTQMSSEEFW